jgi:CPA2 family monovalent cation:H+ antiporter-2
MAPEFATTALSDTLVILGAAGIVIPLFARFRISPVIGFLLVGLIAGPAGLGAMTDRFPWLAYVTISNPESIEPFAEFGIVLLLFSIGLELSFRRLWTMRRLVFGVGAAELFGCAAVIAVILHLMGQNWTGSIGLGLALALSSTALVLPLVGTTSAVGRSALAMLLFEDVAIVPIVFLLGAMGPYGAAEGWTGLAETLGLGILTIALMLLVGRLLLPRLFAQAARTKSPELFLSVSLLIVILSSLATAAVGLSSIMGALVAGILIAETEYRNEVEVTTAPFRGLALGIFLITVGMSVDLRIVAENFSEIALAVVAVLTVKALMTGGLLHLTGARRGVAAETGVLMSSPSETTLIVLAAAGSAQLISPATAGFWQIVTAIGLLITPLLAKLGRIAARRVDLQAQVEVPDLGSEGTTPPAVIIGFGRVGRLVADMLDAHDRPYLAVDSNIDTVAAARREGFPVVFGDASRPGMIDKLQLGRASALILTMDDPVLGVRVTKKVRAGSPDLTIVARARDATHAAELYRAGATDAVPETLESSLQLSEAVLVDLGMAMGPVIASIHEKRAELRRDIMEQGNMLREPQLRRRRLRDALKSRAPV